MRPGNSRGGATLSKYEIVMTQNNDLSKIPTISTSQKGYSLSVDHESLKIIKIEIALMIIITKKRQVRYLPTAPPSR